VTSAQAKVSSAQSTVDGDLSQQGSDTSTSTANALAVAAANRQVTTDQSALADAQSAQQDAKSALTDAQNDVTSSQAAIDADTAKIVTDENQVGTQSASLRSTKQKNAQSLATARQAVTSARVGKTSAELSKRVKEEPAKPGDLEAARAAVVTAQANLVTARRTLAKTVLRAPASGTVATVSARVGQTVQGGGVTLSSSSSSTGSNGSGSQTPLLTLVDLDGLTVTAGFSESDAAKIAVGRPATVTLDALPGKKLAAHVVSIDTLSTVVSNVVTYDVTFALDRSAVGVKPGMSASVDVVARERDNVVNVPSSAVTGSGASASVTVLKDGVQTRVPVVAGLQGDSTTEIVSGLAAGATVVLPTATFSGGSTSTGTNGNRGGGLGGLGGLGGGGNRPAVFVGPGP
jgi:multidrug resistance efflux pump